MSKLFADLQVKYSKQAKTDYFRYANDPVAFAFEVLKVSHLTEQQKTILTNARDNKYLAIKAGHGIGKSWIIAIVVLWFLYTRKPSRVITTAPSRKQVEGILWKYIAEFHTKSNLHGELLTTKLTIGKENGEPTWFAEGFTAKDSVGFQGRHSPNVLIIFDEAVGVPDVHWDSAKSLVMSPTDRFICIGNPTTNACQFRREIDSGSWKVLTMSCYDHPNVIQNKIIIKGAVTREWIEEKKKEYGGIHTDLFRSRVLGEFPQSGSEYIIVENWLEACAVNDMAYAKDLHLLHTPVVVACDVSGGTDEATFGSIYQDGFVSIESFYGYDEVDCANYLIKVADKSLIVVDDIGVGGGVTALVKRHTQYYRAMNVALPATRSEFFNLRSEMYFMLARNLRQAELQIDDEDKELKRQLTNIKKVEDDSGKWRIEPKLQIRKRLGRSPDKADVVAMANYYYDTLFKVQYETFSQYSFQPVTSNYNLEEDFNDGDSVISMFDRIETIMP